MLSRIDEVYKTLVRIYAYKFSEPMYTLNDDIIAIQNQGKSRERAVLELALQTGYKPQEYLALLHENGRSQEEAISEFLKDNVLSVSDGDPEIKRIIAEATGTAFPDPYDRSQYEVRKPEPSKAWYLAPLLLGIIGGLVGYYAVKGRDRDLANNLLVIGILASFLSLLGTGFWLSF